MPKKSKALASDPASEAFYAAYYALLEHPIFAPLLRHADVSRPKDDGTHSGLPRDGWARVQNDGTIRVHPSRRAAPGEWIYVLAHCLLHLAWNHIRRDDNPAWNAACDCVVARFLEDISLGTPPEEILALGQKLPAFPGRDEDAIICAFSGSGVPDWAKNLGTAGAQNDCEWVEIRPCPWHNPPDWGALFSTGLSEALAHAVRVASGDPSAERPRTNCCTRDFATMPDKARATHITGMSRAIFSSTIGYWKWASATRPHWECCTTRRCAGFQRKRFTT